MQPSNRFSIFKEGCTVQRFLCTRESEKYPGRKNYKAVNLVFPFPAAVFDRAIGCNDNALLKSVPSAHSDVLRKLLFKNLEPMLINTLVPENESSIEIMKSTLTTISRGLEDESLLVLKFHLLLYLAEDVLWFGDLSVLDPLPFDHFHYIMKRLMRMTSMRKAAQWKRL